MARYISGVRTGTPTTALPGCSLYSAASVGFSLREHGMFNTTTTATAQKLQRLTSTGTQGTAQTAAKYDPNSNTAQCSFRTTHSAGPTLGDDLGYRVPLGAAVGAGVIWTFLASGILCPTGTGNGIGNITATGTGQVIDAYMLWDE
jgi:hypothetical protein